MGTRALSLVSIGTSFLFAAMLALPAAACPPDKVSVKGRFASEGGKLEVKVSASDDDVEIEVETDSFDAPVSGEWVLVLRGSTEDVEVARIQVDDDGDHESEVELDEDWRDRVLEATGFLLLDGEEIVDESSATARIRVRGRGRERGEDGEFRYRHTVEIKNGGRVKSVFDARVKNGPANTTVVFRLEGESGDHEIEVALDHRGRGRLRTVDRETDHVDAALDWDRCTILDAEGDEITAFDLDCR